MIWYYRAVARGRVKKKQKICTTTEQLFAQFSGRKKDPDTSFS